MRKGLTLVILAIFIFGFSGCNPFAQNEGKVKLYIKDQPIDITTAQHIYITFSEVSAHKTGGNFVPILQEETTIDLKEVMQTKKLIANVSLEAGKYTELKLVITKGEIVFEGSTYSMEVPSMEVKIPCVFDVEQDGTVTITLDFNAKSSIHVVEAGATLRFILRPVIIVESVNYE